MPGPDNLFVLSLSALQGHKAGLLTAIGMAMGNFVHIFAVALGLGALVTQFPSILTFIKAAGIVYLLYLAWQNWQHPLALGAPHSGTVRSNTLSAFALFKRGVLMNVLNPKVVLFFLAFFPHFVDHTSPHQTLQIVLLGTVFVLQTVVIFGLIALLAGSIQPQIRRLPPKVLSGITSGLFICLCLYLLSTDFVVGAG